MVFFLPNCRWNFGVSQLMSKFVSVSLAFLKLWKFDVYVITLHAQLNTSAIKTHEIFPKTWRWTKLWTMMNEQRTTDDQSSNSTATNIRACDGWRARQKDTTTTKKKKQYENERRSEMFFLMKKKKEVMPNTPQACKRTYTNKPKLFSK